MPDEPSAIGAWRFPRMATVERREVWNRQTCDFTSLSLPIIGLTIELTFQTMQETKKGTQETSLSGIDQRQVRLFDLDNEIGFSILWNFHRDA